MQRARLCTRCLEVCQSPRLFLLRGLHVDRGDTGAWSSLRAVGWVPARNAPGRIWLGCPRGSRTPSGETQTLCAGEEPNKKAPSVGTGRVRVTLQDVHAQEETENLALQRGSQSCRPRYWEPGSRRFREDRYRAVAAAENIAPRNTTQAIPISAARTARTVEMMPRIIPI